MDTSTEYIKMCEKATEIQKLFQALEGDWYFCRCTDIKEYPHGYGLMILSHGDPDIVSEFLIKSPTDVWLPRQDQLQAMLDGDFWSQFCDINYWTETDRFEIYDTKDPIDRISLKSFEQFWLAFVMSEKFNKFWNGNDWKEYNNEAN